MINERYITWIEKFLKNRKHTIKTADGSFSIDTDDGLPQGSILSPTLFNLYTKELHKLQDNNTQILQYADDVTITIRSKNKSEIRRKATQIMAKFTSMLESMSLKINPNKCAILDFSECLPIRSGIIINNTEINKENETKILGITIDKNLNFSSHIKNLTEQCKKRINLLKAFSNKRTGAHPINMLRIFNALVMSKIIYATIPIKINTKQSEKLQIIQNMGTRICMELTKTTPIPALNVESNTLPTHLNITKHKLIYIARQISRGSNTATQIRTGESTNNFNNLYRQNKLILDNIPNEQIRHSVVTNLSIESDLITPGIKKKEAHPELLRNLANQTIETRYQDDLKIYTDGSINQSGIGIGIYNSLTHEEISIHIKEKVSIKTTEIAAIFMAMQIGQKSPQKNVTILTDSRSSCTSIRNTYTKKLNRFYENKILQIAEQNQNQNFRIQWIPAHVGLSGNETADKLASTQDPTINTNQISIKTPLKDAKKIINEIIKANWQVDYEQKSLNKGNKHRDLINATIPEKFWVYKLNLNAEQTKQIARIRTGHTYDKKFLKLLNIIEDQNCETCNEIENYEHTIIKCKKFDNIRNKYSKLLNITNINTILQKEDMQT